MNGWGDITEGFTVQYHWSVPQDVHGLIGLMGKKRFKQRLDSLFQHDLPDDIPGAHDIQGRIGAYWHGNEPCHHIAYLYNYIGEGWQCQRWVRTVVDRFYGNQPGSLCGNDDCGQMSAWYIFSAMGFYPVCPGSGQYVIGAPYLPYMRIRLADDRFLEIKAPKVSDKNRYIQSVTWNGQPWTRAYLTHRQLADGGVLEFVMGSKPNPKLFQSKADKPYSLTE